jgi:hypothetical protein
VAEGGEEEAVSDVKMILHTKGQIAALVQSIPEAVTPDPMQGLVMEVRGASRRVLAHGEKGVVWKTFFEFVGSRTLAMFEEGLDLDKFCELLLFKHRRYGAASLEIWGRVGVLQRISAKVERLKNMLENIDLDPGDEGVEDTKLDILGYVALGLRLGQLAERSGRG